MNDTNNGNIVGSEAQEGIISKMITLAKTYSDKSPSEIEKTIKAVLVSPAITESGYLKDLEKLDATDRWNQVFKAISIVINELGIEENDDILDKATNLYLSWLSDQG